MEPLVKKIHTLQMTEGKKLSGVHLITYFL
jgi:hypothetical protein